jgi:methylaspartate mutase S subunit
VIGADVHAVGNKIIDFALREAGYNVINLGVMVSQEEYIQAAIETDADAILVSSLYGHGEIDCQGLRENATRRDWMTSSCSGRQPGGGKTKFRGGRSPLLEHGIQ